MTADRVSPAARLRVRNIAEEEILRFKGDHGRWHKHVHNSELDPMQILKMEIMDRELQTVDCSCRRTRKTSTKELHAMEFMACNPDQELGIVAPREAQALVNLRYHLESIRRSPILSSFLMYDRGREQFSDTRYQFANRSRAQGYGIMAQVDGGDLTMASLEEVDDMPADRLNSRFLLMLGATQRLGAAKGSMNKPTIRITGVFKGADTLAGMVDRKLYHLLPTVNVHLGIEMGIVHESFMAEMREQLPTEEYIRQLLCLNVSGHNLIWEKWMRAALQLFIRTRLAIEEPVPGVQRRRRGRLAFGYDHLGHSEDPNSSCSALVVIEEIEGFDVVIFACKWKAGEDEGVIKDDLKSFWRYFRPDFAMGDAYGIGLLTTLNDELFREGLTTIDRRTIGDGESVASTWKQWAFQPIRFDGPVKHQMAQITAARYKHGKVAVPYVDDLEDKEPVVMHLRELQRQMVNIRAEPTTKPYSTYVRVNSKIGDDLFDAHLAASFALNTAGTGDVPSFISVRQQSQSALLREHRLENAA